jgi:peptidoglycan hydrolase-like protein with peptidoglycan-binding domain
MKRNPWLIPGSVLVATLMTTGAGWAQTSGTSKSDPSSGAGQSGQTIHPSPKGSQGGSQSERTGDSGVPLPKGSAQSGTVDMGKSGGSSGMSSSGAMGNRGSMTNVKEVQQALKDKGYDPGPVDGVMGAKTKEALKSFQNASNLPATGSLNAQTADKLGVQSSSAAGSGSSSSPSSSGSMRSRDNMKSSDTTQGKDTDQPNQTPAK